jgi:hypothetical protein
MENVRLIVRTEIAGTPVRFHMNVTREVADKYAWIRQEQKGLSEMQAYKEARK